MIGLKKLWRDGFDRGSGRRQERRRYAFRVHMAKKLVQLRGGVVESAEIKGFTRNASTVERRGR